MSWQPLDDINNSVANKVQSFKRKNSHITRPEELKEHLDNISKNNRRYKADFADINNEAMAHQEGGQLRNIEPPQNITVPTIFMKNVHHIINEHKNKVAQKNIAVEHARENVKNTKKETDDIIHQLYDSLLEEFQEWRGGSS